MSMSDVFAAVAELVEEVTDVPVDEIEAASRFESLDNWTSLAALQLLTAVEERFGVRLDLRAYFATTRVGDLVSMIAEDAHAR